MENYPIILNVKDIMEILGISKPTAYDIMNRKDFPLIRIGRTKRVYRDKFFSWLDDREKVS